MKKSNSVSAIAIIPIKPSNENTILPVYRCLTQVYFIMLIFWPDFFRKSTGHFLYLKQFNKCKHVFIVVSGLDIIVEIVI